MSDIWEYGDEAGTAGGRDQEWQTSRAAAEPAGPPGPPAVAGAFPWPPAGDQPILSAFGQTWKSATFDPTRFFARTPRSGGTGAALLYYLVLGVLVAGANLFWNVLGAYAVAGSDDSLAAELGLASLEPLTQFLLSPLLLMLGIAVSAGVVHVILLMVGGATHGFGTTVRVFCYAYSPMAFAVVPFVGALVGGIWMLVLAIIGLREAHGVPGWKPAVAVLVPFALALLMGIVLAFVAVAAAAALLGGV